MIQLVVTTILHGFEPRTITLKTVKLRHHHPHTSTKTNKDHQMVNRQDTLAALTVVVMAQQIARNVITKVEVLIHSRRKLIAIPKKINVAYHHLVITIHRNIQIKNFGIYHHHRPCPMCHGNNIGIFKGVAKNCV